jgi:LysM repeat protein
MSDKDSPQSVIDSYKKRQQAAQRAPLMIGVAAVLLVAGAAVIIFWLFGPNRPAFSLFASPTPTVTITPTSTSTATPTNTATVTATQTPSPTVTVTPTASGPFIYVVKEGDSLWAIAVQYQVDLLTLITINNLDPANPVIRVGDQITIPGPDTQLPTPTALPENLPRGAKIQYQVLLGDTMAAIALTFNSTIEEILKENNLDNENEIFVGQILTIPVNIVTPIPSRTPVPPTSTPPPGGATASTQAVTTLVVTPTNAP